MCPDCRVPAERERDSKRKRVRPQYGGDWRKVSAQAIRQHIARYGYRCPFCHRANEKTNPLVTDHVKARDRTNIRVICRSCNSRKGATVDRRHLGR